jgi:IS5 family transposase
MRGVWAIGGSIALLAAVPVQAQAQLPRAGAMDTLFATFDRCLRERGYLPMGGQIVDATLVATPKRWNTKAEKEAIKASKTAAEI